MSLLIAGSAWAFDVGTNYNSANMSYPANSTISQYIVFNSAMQAGGTISFSVDAHGGGGRPLQHDTGQLRIEFYNGASMVGFSQTSYSSGNLLQMNAWSTAPGDNSEPWSTLSLSTSTCGSAGSCSSVTSMKVIMIGTDTSWWAGNYGPQWRLPTVTFNGGSNLAYNPEFGSYGGTMAQGWTSSSGWGACGTTSGSVMCTTTAAGVTANMSGGGYSDTGGTTGGQPGGYSGTLSIADANAGTGGGSGGGSAAPTVVSTSTTNSTSTAVTYGSSSVTGTSPTVRTIIGTDINGNPVVYYYQDTTQIVSTPETTTITTTPVTTTTYSDGTTTTSNGTPTSTATTRTIYSTNIVPGVTPTIVDATVANSIFIDQVGANNTITVDQSGNRNRLQGIGQQDAVIYGNNNTVSITQGGINSSPNRLDLYLNGDFNSVTTSQGINTSMDSTAGHYQTLSITGSSNTVSTQQSNNGSGNHLMTTTITGNSNNVTAIQTGNNSKTATTSITGNSNTVGLSQSGTGQHSVEATLLGTGNSASVTQTGGYANSASITLQNAGGASSATLVQNGNTGSNAYSVTQICSNPAGCSVSVTQTK